MSNFLKRIRGFSFAGGGLQWSEDPQNTRVDKVVAEHIKLSNNPHHTPLDPPFILRAGAATLHANSELLDVCKQLNQRGYPHQFIAWENHGIDKSEFLDFAKWQITTRAAKTILTSAERDEIVSWFKTQREADD